MADSSKILGGKTEKFLGKYFFGRISTLSHFYLPPLCVRIMIQRIYLYVHNIYTNTDTHIYLYLNGV